MRPTLMRTLAARPLVTTVVLAALTLGATACGGGDDPAPEGPQDAGGTSFAPDPEESSATPAPEPSEGTEKPGATETVTGTVSAGVEPGCLLLEAEGQSLLLVGAAPDDATDGDRVTVTGVREPGAVSTCQEGVPFRVQSLEPAS